MILAPWSDIGPESALLEELLDPSLRGEELWRGGGTILGVILGMFYPPHSTQWGLLQISGFAQKHRTAVTTRGLDSYY